MPVQLTDSKASRYPYLMKVSGLEMSFIDMMANREQGAAAAEFKKTLPAKSSPQQAAHPMYPPARPINVTTMDVLTLNAGDKEDYRDDQMKRSLQRANPEVASKGEQQQKRRRKG